MIKLTTALAIPVSGSSAKEIVFIPEGENMIYPLSHPDGVKVVLPADRGPAIAAAFNGKLQEMMGRNVPPWFDFEHSRKAPKSGAPKAFRYEAGKGIMCSVEWSGSGKQAIDNKDVEHFSPEFYVDDNGVPCGIPDRGPLGGLVAEPAFRNIPAVAASEADDDPCGGTSSEFENRAAALVRAGEASDIVSAYQIVAAEDPGCYDRYVSSLPPAPNPYQKQTQAIQAADSPNDFEEKAANLVSAGRAPNLVAAYSIVEAEHPGSYQRYCAAIGY